jgi:hypothetical protein
VPLWKLLAGNGVFVATTRFAKGHVQRDYYVFVGEKGYSPWYHPLGVTKCK